MTMHLIYGIFIYEQVPELDFVGRVSVFLLAGQGQSFRAFNQFSGNVSSL